MENRIVVDFDALDRITGKLNTAGSELDAALSMLSCAAPGKVNGGTLRLNGADMSFRSVGGTVSAGDVAQAVRNYRSAIERLGAHSRELSGAVKQVASAFRSAESVCGKTPETGTAAPTSEEESFGSKFVDAAFNWKSLWKLLGNAGLIGTAIATIGEQITGGTTTLPKRILQVLKGVAKLGEGISKGVAETSFDWSRLWGGNAAITTDSPTNFFSALKAEGQKYSFGNAKGTAGKAAVACKWAGAILTVAVVGYDNWTGEDDKDNSVGRKIGETVIESAVKIGGGMLVSAGVAAGAAALGIVGAPALAIGAAATVITIAANAVCTAVTGKDIAENVSDFVFDTAVPWVEDTAIPWVKDTAEKVGNAVSAAGKTISGWWKGLTGGTGLAFA